MSSFSLSGGVQVFGFISPSDTNDQYAVIDPLYGIDGFRNVDTLIELNNIPTQRRRAGMVVGVSGGTIYYKLNLPPWNNTITDWTTFSSGGNFTGGTISGATIFINGLSANTISATTYQNLPIDVFVTGGTYGNGTTTFINNTGGTFSVSGFYTGETSYVNTLNVGNGLSADTTQGNITLINTEPDQIISLNDGLNINVSGSYPNFTISTLSTISASTYQNLPLDIFVTGGTFSAGTLSFTNNSGGTFSVSGISSFDTFVTAFTYNNNTFTIFQNSGNSLTASINSVTGLTINGDLTSVPLSGVTDRIVQVNSGGTFTASSQIVSAYITPGGTAALLLENTLNWDGNGVYTGSTITNTFQGQKHYDLVYFYEAVADNTFVRWARI